MPLVFKETFTSKCSQQEIWRNLTLYAELGKSIFDDPNSFKKFILTNEGYKYYIYSEMRGFISLPFLKNLNRINTDMYAQIEFVKSEHNTTIINYKVIKSFTRILSEGLHFLVLLSLICLGPFSIAEGKFWEGFLLILLSSVFLFFVLKQRKMLAKYKAEYIDLFNKIKT